MARTAQILPQSWRIKALVGVGVFLGAAMTDPNMRDFYSRVTRIERTHAKGYAFLAEGTLGRAPRPARRSRLVPVLRSAMFLVMGVICLKGVLNYQVGPDLYDQRVERLAAGDEVERIGATIMWADPASVWVADRLRDWMPPRG